MSKDLLKVLSDEVTACKKCVLHKTRTQTVFSRGSSTAEIMIISEAPGQTEDELGLPLVGASGQLLDKTLDELGISSNKDCFIANIIKCRPPNNRAPTDEECYSCIDYLESQIEIVRPKVIVALGNTAIHNLTNTTYGITKLHGKFLKYKSIPVMCCYHPSYVLRNGSSGQVFEDFKSDLQSAINKTRETS